MLFPFRANIFFMLGGKHGPHAERVDPNQARLFQPDELLDHVAKHEAVNESPGVVQEHRRRGGATVSSGIDSSPPIC